MRGIYYQVENYLVDLTDEAMDGRQSGIKLGKYVGHIFALVTANYQRVLNGAIQIDPLFFVRTRVENSFMARTICATRSTPSID